MGHNRTSMAASTYPHCKWGKRYPPISLLHFQAARTAWMYMEKTFWSLSFYFFFYYYSKALIANPFVFQLQGTPHLEGSAWQMRGSFTAEIAGWALERGWASRGWGGWEKLIALLNCSNNQGFPERCWEHTCFKSACISTSNATQNPYYQNQCPSSPKQKLLQSFSKSSVEV